MKKIYVTKVQQYNQDAYVGSVDPRILVRMVDQSIEVGQTQEAQRPLEKKHIMEIAKHVGMEGLLPTSIIVGTKSKKLGVETENSSTGDLLYYIMLPETETELSKYENTIDISDGQHRIFAFSNEYRNPNLKDSDVYEVPVSFYIMPQLDLRRKLFYTTNAKQNRVSQNLLLYLKDQLKLLDPIDSKYLPLVRLLNSENVSPLKNRIILSAEKIPKGYKAREIIRIFDKAKLDQLGLTLKDGTIDDNKMLDVLSKYLNGWEAYYNLEFQHPKQETMTKISGLRYIILLLPTFTELAVRRKELFSKTYITNTIKLLEEAKDLDSTNNETLFNNNEADLSFRGESATIKLADKDSRILKAYIDQRETDGFNPFV